MADNVYPPSPDFVAQANVRDMEGYRELYQRAAEKPEDFWGDLAENGAALVPQVDPCFRVASALRQMVRRRHDQRLLQLHRPPPDDAAQE